MPLVYWGLLSVIIFSEIDPSNIKRKEHGLYPVLFLLSLPVDASNRSCVLYVFL